MQEDLSTLRFVDLDGDIQVVSSTIVSNLDSYIPDTETEAD